MRLQIEEYSSDMALVALMNGIQHLELWNSCARRKLSSFDDLLNSFDKYVIVEDFELLHKNHNSYSVIPHFL